MSLSMLIKRNETAEVSVEKLIQEHYLQSRTIDPWGEDDWIRISSIGMMCPREEVLCSLNGIVRNDKISSDLGINFEHGHYVHWMFQNKIFPTLGVIIGSWRCTYCGEVYGSRETRMVPRPSSCIRCGAIAGERQRTSGYPDFSCRDNAFLYVEEWLGNEEYQIGGSPDGQMIASYDPNYRDEDLTLLEFKSAHEMNYKKYSKAPDLVHVIQTNCYMFLTGIRRAKIIYFNKNGGDDTVKEHDIDYDQEMMDRVLAAILEVRAGIRDRVVPTRTVCYVATCPRAKGCKARNLCFPDVVKE